MSNLQIAIPPSLAVTLRNAAAKRGTSIDSLVSAALSEYFQSAKHRVYQISTSGALVEGVYQGAISSRELLRHGDFGLGTFESLDGEMVIVDGVIYQVLADGRVERRQDDFQIPFGVVVRFEEEESFSTGTFGSLKDLEDICDRHRDSDNLFYALRIDGEFDMVHTRAVGAVIKGARLVDAAKKQAEFYFSDIEGTLVCIWSPAYSSAFNVPGYHFHFISKDRTKGGHVLDCGAKALRAGLQMLCEYDVRLPEAGAFLTTDFSKDPSLDLAKTE